MVRSARFPAPSHRRGCLPYRDRSPCLRTASPTFFRSSDCRSKVGGRFDSPAGDRPKEPNPSPVQHPGGDGPILTNRRRLCKPAIGSSERSDPSLPFLGISLPAGRKPFVRLKIAPPSPKNHLISTVWARIPRVGRQWISELRFATELASAGNWSQNSAARLSLCDISISRILYCYDSTRQTYRRRSGLRKGRRKSACEKLRRTACAAAAMPVAIPAGGHRNPVILAPRGDWPDQVFAPAHPGRHRAWARRNRQTSPPRGTAVGP